MRLFSRNREDRAACDARESTERATMFEIYLRCEGEPRCLWYFNLTTRWFQHLSGGHSYLTPYRGRFEDAGPFVVGAPVTIVFPQGGEWTGGRTYRLLPVERFFHPEQIARPVSLRGQLS